MKQHKSIKLPQELIDIISADAKENNRSFNNMVEVALKVYYMSTPTPINNNGEKSIVPRIYDEETNTHTLILPKQ